MITVHFVLMLLAFVCFLLVAGDFKAPRINLLGLGLTFWTLAILLAGR
jgi:hypothetical protein